MIQGYYINLEHSTARRESLEQHLRYLGIQQHYQRFAAIDGKQHSAIPARMTPSEFGCWMSHMQILRQNAHANLPLHIIEDDTIFAGNALQLFAPLLTHADQVHPGWDLIFTDIFVPIQASVFRVFLDAMKGFYLSRACQLIDLAPIPFASLSSYLVNPRSIKKLLDLLEGGWSTGSPIDLHVRRLVNQGHIKAYLTLPFLTSIAPSSNDSTIRGQLNLSLRVGTVYRRGFFKDADLEQLHAELNSLVQGEKIPKLASLFYLAHSFSVSDQWQDY